MQQIQKSIEMQRAQKINGTIKSSSQMLLNTSTTSWTTFCVCHHCVSYYNKAQIGSDKTKIINDEGPMIAWPQVSHGEECWKNVLDHDIVEI